MTLSGTHREKCKTAFCNSEWFYDKDDHTTTTTTTTTNTTNKINNTVHPMRCHAVIEVRRKYSFNTLSKSAHIGVGGQHEVPAAFPLEKPGTDFIDRIRGPRNRYGKTRKTSPTGF